MKKSAIAIAALLALSTGAANAQSNTELLNGFTGKIEADYTTQEKNTKVEAQLGYDFNFGAVSVIPFLAAETNYSGEKDILTNKYEGFDRGALGGGFTVRTNFDNFYAYAEGRVMVKDRINLTVPNGELPELPIPELPELPGAELYGGDTLVKGTVNQYRVKLGTGYQFDNGFSAGVEAAMVRESFKDLKEDQREIFAVAGYNFTDNLKLFAKVGAADTGDQAELYKKSKDDGKWETKTVIGVSYAF
ncbi:hypothetical protein [Shewanella waksmanii]|uniref:hypothetical protein n=1 Tax=Shewanella waksmanii TaxID=213783 RepID=UPI00048CBEEA|nr:hypothetical protein [Shewanella waksmanii]